MFSRVKYWRDRCKAAETSLIAAEDALKKANEYLQGIEQRFASRAAIVSITQQGRALRFTFVRGEKLIVVETYSTMSDDVPGWKKELFE